jgi:hypothetical protein
MDFMMSEFIMKIDDLVCAGSKTILSGVVKSGTTRVLGASCLLVVDGKVRGVRMRARKNNEVGERR